VSVEFEVAGAFDECVDPGVDVVHDRGQRGELGDGFLLLAVRRSPVLRRLRHGRLARLAFDGAQDVDDFADVQVTVHRDPCLNLPGQNGNGVPAQRLDRQREVSPLVDRRKNGTANVLAVAGSGSRHTWPLSDVTTGAS